MAEFFGGKVRSFSVKIGKKVAIFLGSAQRLVNCKVIFSEKTTKTVNLRKYFCKQSTLFECMSVCACVCVVGCCHGH